MITMTLAQVRQVGRAGERYRDLSSGFVYRFVELRDGTGFDRDARFELTT